MNWRRLGVPSRAALVTTVSAVLALVVPPISVAIGLVAVACSGVAIVLARRHHLPSSLAQRCMAVSGGLVVLVVAGNAAYGAAS